MLNVNIFEGNIYNIAWKVEQKGMFLQQLHKKTTTFSILPWKPTVRPENQYWLLQKWDPYVMAYEILPKYNLTGTFIPKTHPLHI